MTMKPSSEGGAQTAPRRRPAQAISVTEIHDNTSQQVISITSDKLKLALIEHLDCLEKTNSWHMPLSLFVGVVVVFSSSTFNRAFGLAAETWSAIFILFGAACFVWLAASLVRMKRAKSLDELIEIIKNKQ